WAQALGSPHNSKRATPGERSKGERTSIPLDRKEYGPTSLCRRHALPERLPGCQGSDKNSN
ncbi:MAG TPA: hypothetical protein VFE08_13225, partial [Candidatus Sulfotelmatobacter sp.]|nr:hypothetical protein [Candidatus Sulfotelmatobacter sp.]